MGFNSGFKGLIFAFYFFKKPSLIVILSVGLLLPFEDFMSVLMSPG